ncbi:MAG: alpha/beta fold hydrolase, partial [Bacteroidota bacterium]
MPIVKNTSYQKAPFFLRSGHWETIYPAIFRWVGGIRYQRERLTLSDGDFVDLDWIGPDRNQLALLVHGLEGNSERHYMKGMAKLFDSKNWGVLALNCRSCSGEMNRKLRLYNHGEIGDLGEVIQHALSRKKYESIVLVGFSMGGSIILKYLGVNAKTLPAAIKKAVVFSSPCDLKTSVAILDDPAIAFYRNRFFKMLAPKMRIKAKQFPEVLDIDNLNRITKWEDFDNYFSAPVNGYKDAQDFYYQASAIHFMEPINIPTLLVNALNDPILTPECFPYQMLEQHPFIYLETPK